MAIAEDTLPRAALDELDRAAGTAPVCRVRPYGLGGAGFLAVIGLVAYEWIFSGLTKLVRGGFPTGLTDALHGMDKDMPGWYHGFLTGAVLPHVRTFAVLIMIGELAVGITLMTAAVVAGTRRRRLSARARTIVLAATLAASVAGAFMALNFHFAMGANAPWQMPKDGFDESVDLDALLVGAQVVIAAVALHALVGNGARRTAVATVAVVVALAAGGIGIAAATSASATRTNATSALPAVGPAPIAVTLPTSGYALTLHSPNVKRAGGTITLHVARAGRPVAGARVRLMFSMPGTSSAMGSGVGMSSLAVRLAQTRPGEYAGMAPALPMAGNWLIGVNVEPAHSVPVGAAVSDSVTR